MHTVVFFILSRTFYSLTKKRRTKINADRFRFFFLSQNRRLSFVMSRCLLGRTSTNKILFDFDFFPVTISLPYYSVIKIEPNFSGKLTVFEIRRRHIFVKIINFDELKEDLCKFVVCEFFIV